MSDNVKYIYILVIVSPTDGEITTLTPYLYEEDAKDELTRLKKPYGADFPFLTRIEKCPLEYGEWPTFFDRSRLYVTVRLPNFHFTDLLISHVESHPQVKATRWFKIANAEECEVEFQITDGLESEGFEVWTRVLDFLASRKIKARVHMGSKLQ